MPSGHADMLLYQIPISWELSALLGGIGRKWHSPALTTVGHVVGARLEEVFRHTAVRGGTADEPSVAAEREFHGSQRRERRTEGFDGFG